MKQKTRSILVRMMKEEVARVHVVKTDNSVIEVTNCTLYRALHFIEIHTASMLVIIPVEDIHSIQTTYKE